MKQADKVTST